MTNRGLRPCSRAFSRLLSIGGFMTIAVSQPRGRLPFEEGRPPRRDHWRPFLEPEGHTVNRQIDRHLSTEADRIGGSAASAISFGPFRLLATQRLLLDGDRFVRLGCRALDILIALAERPGELVSKREL